MVLEAFFKVLDLMLKHNYFLQLLKKCLMLQALMKVLQALKSAVLEPIDP